jgi:RNA-binding protein YhbY
MLKARDFIMNFDDPLKYKRSISKSSSKDLERKLENFWMIKILLTNSGEKESQEVYERIKAYSDKLTSIGPTILVSELEEKCVKENFSEEKDIRR